MVLFELTNIKLPPWVVYIVEGRFCKSENSLFLFTEFPTHHPVAASSWFKKKKIPTHHLSLQPKLTSFLLLCWRTQTWIRLLKLSTSAVILRWFVSCCDQVLWVKFLTYQFWLQAAHKFMGHCFDYIVRAVHVVKTDLLKSLSRYYYHVILLV